MGSTLTIAKAATPSTLTSVQVTTQFAPGSPDYSAFTGNTSVSMDGAVSNVGDQLSGQITRATVSYDKFLGSGAIEGDFQLSGSASAIGHGTAHAAVSGNLTGFTHTYADGSLVKVSGLAATIGTLQQVDYRMLTVATWWGGDDDMTITMPAHITAPLAVASGAGDDRVSLQGGGGRLDLDAGSGNDVISLLGDNHRIDGGVGRDTVTIASTRAASTLLNGIAGLTVTDGAGASSTLVNVERIAFSDTTVAFDVGGSAGQAYRLYQAAFNRTPDAAGLGFHIWALDTVGVSLDQVAQGFIDSQEFSRTYGSLSNRDFVIQLYANVLHRAPDAAGLKFHTDLLDAGTVSRATDLVGFSESPENQAALIGIIGNGFTYTAHG